MQAKKAVPTKYPLVQGANATHECSRSTFRPVLIEVAGSLGNAVCQDVTRRLRQHRNRYAPILRLSATLMAPEVPEVELFGFSEGVGVGDEWSANDKEETTEEKETCGHNRGCWRSDSPMTKKRPRADALISAPRAAITAERRIEVVHRLHENNGDMTAVEKLEAFMAYHFLPLALTHNCWPEFFTR
ncbi:hypothetical protein TRSC58_02994 [Trypanosoma rangeli SC58]|uniref:Uncharacterized protein n=1 Tax=Trypanosoma rangeli SC58 TaxID=429131 RepID=A0A061J1I9_TRYRA|nr:hypothetical protein TRSC58_02994 [Trypanosoma rangeli SC58]